MSENVEEIANEEIELTNEEKQDIEDSLNEDRITERDEEVFKATHKIIEKTIVETLDECINRINNIQAPRFKTAQQQQNIIIDVLKDMKSDYVDTLEAE